MIASSGHADSGTVAIPAPPTRVRYQVVALTVLLAMVTYLDRVCISKLAPDIMQDLSLSKVQMGYVFSAFALAYALFEIATAAATGFASLLVIRFLFGVGEAGAWPCVARTFSRWIPRRERGTVQGIFFAGAHLVGGLTPALVLWLLQFLSWRQIFVCFAGLGFVWTA